MRAVAEFWRRHRAAVLDSLGDTRASPVTDATGELAHALLWLHYHAIDGLEEGIAAAAFRARDFGATRDQLLEILALAFINSGPRGMRAVALACNELMVNFRAVDGAASFPAGWAPDSDALRSGIDFSAPDLSATELELLRAWYRRWLGELPPYVEFLGRYRPGLLKVYRNRFENAVRDALPRQIVPFVLLHYETARGSRHGTREAALLARGFGVSRAQAIEAVLAAFAYVGPAAVTTFETSTADFIEGWP